MLAISTRAVAAGSPAFRSEAVGEIAAVTGRPRREIYQRALALAQDQDQSQDHVQDHEHDR